MTDLNLKGDLDNPWKAFLSEVYLSGRPPYPLGTVSPAEIERMAQEKLKDQPGKAFPTFQHNARFESRLIRGIHVLWGQRWEKFDLPR